MFIWGGEHMFVGQRTYVPFLIKSAIEKKCKHSLHLLLKNLEFTKILPIFAPSEQLF